MKKILNKIIMIILFIILVLSYISYSFIYQKQNTNNMVLRIEKGDTILNIYKKIGLNYNIIDKIYFKITKEDRKIKNGIYEFKENKSKYEIIKYIIKTINNEVKLTIPEGFTTNQVLERIERLDLATKTEMLTAMKEYDFYYKHSSNFEGYFYPETYHINKLSEPKEILDIILGKFLEKFPITEYDKNKMYDIVTLASIIEKEVVDEEDRAKVSAVFHNRLNKNMLLQSDATLKYELNRKVLKKDLQESNSLYNTYKHKGLTPTPIANPRYESIYAAMYPEKDFKYLYFFMYNGKTYYSNTHDEHLRKRKESGHIK